MTQPPVRYENYPPEQGDAHEDTTTDRLADPGPVVRQYVAPQLPSRTVGDPTTRRSVIGLLVAAPIVVLIGLGVLNEGAPEVSGNGTNPWDQPSGEATSADPPPEDITVGGRYPVSVPLGWENAADGGGGVVFTRAANRLAASSIEVPPATLATDQLAVLAKGHRKGFTGKIGRPVDDSTADVQRASMAGTGTFKGKAATLMAEIWIDGSGSGLLITRILTAQPDTEIAVQAQAIVDELAQGF